MMITTKHWMVRWAAWAALGWAVSGTAWAQANWPTAGQNLGNSRNQASETLISPGTVASLKLKWTAPSDGDVTANPAIDGDYAYYPDSAGFLYKVNRLTGAIVWKNPISAYTGITGDFARATPAVAGNALILGNQSGKFLQAFGQPAPQPAHVFAVDKNTGSLLWSTQVDNTVMSFVTQSAVVANNTVYVGLASNEELVAGFVPKAYWTFKFRGSVVALDATTGAIKWQTYTVPSGYSGGSVWGSTGAVDPDKGLLYMATGNNYSVPQSVLDCLNNGGAPATCLSPDDHFDSIVALDMNTGALVWSAKGLPFDAWNVGCGLNVPGFVIPPNDNCPNPNGPDWDFAQGPMLIANGNGVGIGNQGKIVGAGQKSGKFWAFKANDGKLAWVTQVAPPGLTGGLQWGSAYDGNRIYVAVSNSGLTGGGTSPGVWTLKDGSTTTSGGWAALDPKTGGVLWTTKDPLGSRAEAAVSVANGVVFGCNLDPVNGTMYGLDASTGAPLWSANSGAPCNAGPSIANGMVLWGSGTFSVGGATGSKKVYGFGF